MSDTQDTLQIDGNAKFTFASDPDTAAYGFMRLPSYRWKPQPDITAYELALCWPIMVSQSVWGIASLPDEAKRHFEEVAE